MQKVVNLHRLVKLRCRFYNSQPDLVPNHPGAQSRLDKQYQETKQNQLVNSQWNANGILHEMAALEMVLESMQVTIQFNSPLTNLGGVEAS